jgi:hypothetical protein
MIMQVDSRIPLVHTLQKPGVSARLHIFGDEPVDLYSKGSTDAAPSVYGINKGVVGRLVPVAFDLICPDACNGYRGVKSIGGIADHLVHVHIAATAAHAC